eukprot:CAMPEP_0205892676 /NCGR_PEP_ID=MMETSP1083-20121108/22818_1 /ASSEMBLY_ACC=CAM_ASM_000430 /TAXON_ID=97485 /ORGANISM="Prymnesium parvum, Strain Texoma1" /LENGTH=101 /DNA_ID=CAMNT_0053257239 /DNA_START=367 /DNA_END=672 /DNA_ORIENTATION=+
MHGCSCRLEMVRAQLEEGGRHPLIRKHELERERNNERHVQETVRNRKIRFSRTPRNRWNVRRAKHRLSKLGMRQSGHAKSREEEEEEAEPDSSDDQLDRLH